MNRGLLAYAIAFVTVLQMATLYSSQAREDPAVEHAKRVFSLLREEKFEEVTKEFNAPVAAALSVSQLRDVWSTLRQQAGTFTSIVDQRVATPAAGLTAVILGCQFENAALNVILTFDAESKIAGLRFAPRTPPTESASLPPTSSHFTEESVTIGTGEWALPGTLSMPVGPIAAAVVLVHGSGANDRDETLGPNKPFRDLAWGLADRGIAVLRYDKRTRRYGAKMAGNKELTVREETTDDAVLAAELLRAHDRINPKRVLVLGHSLGGMLAPRIAAQDARIAGLIIMAGPTRPLLDLAREQFAYLASLGAAGTPDAGVEMLRRSAPDAYWKDLETYHPAQAAAKLTVPMLILQGERDYQVTLADLQGWRDALDGHPGVTIKSYPTLNHLFLPGEGKSTPAEYERPAHIPDMVLDDIKVWLDKHITM